MDGCIYSITTFYDDLMILGFNKDLKTKLEELIQFAIKGDIPHVCITYDTKFKM